MRVLDGLETFDRATYPKPVLALGNFDGVHLGHQAIFHEVTAHARATGGTGVVFTFDPHPLQVLRPTQAPPLLTTFEQKIRLIAAQGMDVVLRVPFTDAFAQQSPEDFIRHVLCERIGSHEVVVGHDFRFGHNRAGTADLLQAQGLVYGYRATIVPAISVANMTVSSSNIRRLVKRGDVEDAARLLGRFYAIEGPVIEGFRRGTTIGFPTANVQSINDIVPHIGVYAVRVGWRGRLYAGVANVGYSPTFANQNLSVEAHLFDFAADLYGETIHVEFVRKIRDERKFASVDELTAQIARDASTARAIHAEQPSPA